VNYKDLLVQKIQNRKAVIDIVGLGCVGLPLALRFVEAGYQVLGFDIDPVKPERIAAGQGYFRHILGERVIEAVQSGFSATTDFSRVGIALHEGAIDRVVPVSSNRTAEMTKSLENIHCAVNIGLVTR